MEEPIHIAQTRVVRWATRIARLYTLSTSDWTSFCAEAAGDPDTAAIFQVEGRSFMARVENDDSSGPPWEDGDGHGVVSDWVRRPKRPWELILSQDRGSFRFYDFRAGVRKAREVWGCSNPDQAARGDFERLRDWGQDRWHYIGVIVVPLDFRGEVVAEIEASLWGIESDAANHLADIAHELARECLAALPREVMP